jgi:hypothetical protein
VLNARRRLSPHLAAPVALAALIVLVAFGSSGVQVLDRIGSPGRWAALLLLVAVAGATVLFRKAPLRLTPVLCTVASLAVLGLVSAAWSVLPSLTLQRAGTFAVLLLAAALLGLAAAADASLARLLVQALVVAALVLALLGLIHYLADASAAVQAANVTAGARFRGIGENPNTLPMLYAIVLPAAAWLALTTERLPVRLAWLAAAALLLGSISASSSRGAMVGAAPAVALVLLLAARGKVLAVAAAVAAAMFALAVAGTTISGPLSTQPVAVATSAPAATGAASTVSSATDMRSLVAADGTPADLIADVGADPNEVGRPRPGLVGETVRRTLFGSSGRAQAWDGGLRQSLERPLLGYGFGTEDRVFLDRFYVFVSARIENSYLGLWLQIGLVGLFVFLAVLAALAGRLARSWRDLRRSPGPSVAAAGIVVSGAVMAIPQSYVYSVGNVATAAFWVGALMLGAGAARERAR